MFKFGSQVSVGSAEAASGGGSPALKDVNARTCGELFAGCGAMAAGIAQAGFRHEWMVEVDTTACETLRNNLHVHRNSLCATVREGDVREIDWTRVGTVDLLAGGPPCQPFSRGGSSGGENDPRDMWPEAIRAVRYLQPRAFLFENVKGLLRPAFAGYLARIVDGLQRGGQDEFSGPDMYEVAVVSVNAADYGAPQRRERVLIAGVRADCGSLRTFPRTSHSIERLVWEKWITGQYWERHGVPRPECGPTSRIEQTAFRKLVRTGIEPEELPWLTCRDAFVGLGEPKAGTDRLRHEFRAGARTYPGHEGSPIDEPAKALKAGCHGIPGGENMVVDGRGGARYFTVREAARLQGMPDTFIPVGSWSQTMRQLGNAMPTQLAAVAGHWLGECLGAS
jgi:DNA (cytosine-5)-methyltransferase 1